MPIFPDAPLRLHVAGRVGRRAIEGMASLAVDADGVLIAPLDAALQAASVQRVPFDGIDGVSTGDADGATLHLHLADGEALVARGDGRVAELARDILRRGRVLPELTRAVRTLGARSGGAEQELFLTPVLEARRAATRDWQAAIDAFDPPALQLAIEQAIVGIAAAREPNRPPARRALEARLADALEPVLLALEPVARAAPHARSAPPAQALRAWREWVRAVASVFDRLDAAWSGVQAVLGATRAPSRATPPAPLARLLPPWNS